jgi:hypothetical protein
MAYILLLEVCRCRLDGPSNGIDNSVCLETLYSPWVDNKLFVPPSDRRGLGEHFLFDVEKK